LRRHFCFLSRVRFKEIFHLVKAAFFLYFGIDPESIEWFIKDQAFSPSYDLAPPTTPLPLSLEKAGSLSQFSCMSSVELTDGRGRRVAGAKTYEGEKAWSSINHSILYA
jgi:hypothetical protein